MTLTGCTFDAATKLYINPNTGNTAVTMTLNNCKVVGGAPVASVLVDYSENMTTDIDWKFVIDGTVIDKNSVFASGTAIVVGDNVNFNLSFKGQVIATLTIPREAIADPTKPVTVTFVSINPADTITLGDNVKSYAYDIDVTNLKANPDDRAPITVVLAVPNALAAANVYHNGELIEDYTYDEVNGTVTFQTTSFSPYAVSYTEYEVTTIEQLREYASLDNVNIKLMADIYVNLDPNAAENDCDPNHFCKLTGQYEYYNGVNINGKNVAIDLNGHNIIVSGNKEGDTVGAIFFIMPNSNLNINDSVGGGMIKLQDPAYIVWAPYDAEYGLSYVDVYGGIFMSHGYAGDERTPGRFAMFYAGEGGIIDIYGGYFLYENDDYTDKNGVVHPNNNNGFCNVMNSATTPCITIHDGATLINSYYRQDGYVNNVNNWQADHDSIFLANGSELVQISKEVVIDGVTYNTWYQVKCNHTGGTATCITQATCDYCGKGYGALADHNYSAATCQTPSTCTVCGVTTGGTNPDNHVLNAETAPWNCAEATCDKYCYCGEKVFSAFHNWDNGVCTTCGRTNNFITVSNTYFASGTKTNIPVTFNGANASSYTVLLYQGTSYDSDNALNGLVMYYKAGAATGFVSGGGTGINIFNQSLAANLPEGIYTIRVWNSINQVVDTKVIELVNTGEYSKWTARDIYNSWANNNWPHPNPGSSNGYDWGTTVELKNDGQGEYVRITTKGTANVGCGRLFLAKLQTYTGGGYIGIRYRNYSGGSIPIWMGTDVASWSAGSKGTLWTAHSASEWYNGTCWSYTAMDSFGVFSIDLYTGAGDGRVLDIQYIVIGPSGADLNSTEGYNFNLVYGWG